MPPDADKLRQRKGNDADEVIVKDDQLVKSLSQLKTNEVCIDGAIYDLNSFDHPGGETIHIFGGNDVTVQYKMIHPYHTSKHLEKMKKVGKVADYNTVYKFDTPFERELKEEVFKIVRRGREFGTFGWFFRMACYVSIFFYLSYLWGFKGTSYALAVVYGLSQSAIGMNVQHDANHGACSKKPWINDILGLGADLIGGSKWLWQEQHWTHHAYTNDVKDPDAYGAEPFLLFNDYPLGDPKRTWIHHFQALFYIPVLAGYWLSSVFNPEIIDLRQRGAQGVGFSMESPFIVSRRKYAILLRLYYIGVNVVAPFVVHGGWSWDVFAHIMVMGASSSLGLAILFSLSHNFEASDRDPTAEARKSGEPVCWFKSQVETSCTYGGFISGCFTGGLNFQIEHHLFPRMSSAWYPFIAPTVRRVCKKHGVRYIFYPWVFQNLYSTVKYMHAAGTGSHWKENPFSGKL